VAKTFKSKSPLGVTSDMTNIHEYWTLHIPLKAILSMSNLNNNCRLLVGLSTVFMRLDPARCSRNSACSGTAVQHILHGHAICRRLMSHNSSPNFFRKNGETGTCPERSRGIHPEFCRRIQFEHGRGKPSAKFSFFFLPHRLICSSRRRAEL
jgi:hypothetical protein